MMDFFTWYPSQQGSELSILSLLIIVLSESNPREMIFDGIFSIGKIGQQFLPSEATNAGNVDVSIFI